MHRQLDFLLKLGPRWLSSHGMQSAEVEDAYTRANEIGEKFGDGTAVVSGEMGPVDQRQSQAQDRARASTGRANS